ncbi:MAG: hypothetical protein IT328_07485 [Caldilineaceae bacterium]|nr:hypothetical protein [Caldilineaceae bacterium]
MPAERKPLQNFNIDTMSGIYPGSRTMIYQRLRLHHQEEAHSHWYQLQWYSDPPAAVLLQMRAATPTTAPLLSLPEPDRSDFVERLHNELAAREFKADACFACRHWHPLSVHTTDGLPAGRCGWSDAQETMPSALSTQSALSLACEHFQRLDEPRTSPITQASPSTSHPRVLKLAELDPDRLPFWPRLWHRLSRRGRRQDHPTSHWADQVIERSGVGAGTEPCFVCQGRLGNLGALAVASPEGDKQTLSIWRCRNCYTTYFNDWTDRWERLDSLETEELYYRIAPAEAYAAMQIIRNTVGGDHPGGRAERRQERAQLLTLVAGKQPLSHQVRQGR